ncbi:MAG: hypothetical protein KBD37_04500 [Burkholderiales bacterium]|nr:hypothetical protein [Burkholderiales bacterium]
MSRAIDNIFSTKTSSNVTVNYYYAPKQGGIAAVFHELFSKIFGSSEARVTQKMDLARTFAIAIKNNVIDKNWGGENGTAEKLIFDHKDIKVVLEGNSKSGYDLVRYKKSVNGFIGERRVYLHMKDKNDEAYKHLQTATEFFLNDRTDLFGIVTSKYMPGLKYETNTSNMCNNDRLELSLKYGVKLDPTRIKTREGEINAVLPGDVIYIYLNKKWVYLKCIANLNDGKQHYKVVEPHDGTGRLIEYDKVDKVSESHGMGIFKTRKPQCKYVVYPLLLDNISLDEKLSLVPENIKDTDGYVQDICPGDGIAISSGVKGDRKLTYLKCIGDDNYGKQQYKVIHIVSGTKRLSPDEINKLLVSDTLNEAVDNKPAQMAGANRLGVNKASQPIQIPTSKPQPLSTKLKDSFEEGWQSFGEKLQDFALSTALVAQMSDEMQGLSNEDYLNNFPRVDREPDIGGSNSIDTRTIAENNSLAQLDNKVTVEDLNATGVVSVDAVSDDEDKELGESDMVVICGGTGATAADIEKQYKKWAREDGEDFDESTVFLDGPGMVGLTMPTQQVEMQKKIEVKMAKLKVKGESELEKERVITIDAHSRGCFHALALCHYYKEHHPEIKIRLHLTVPVGGPVPNSILKYKSIPDNVKIAEVIYTGQTFMGRVGDHSIFFAESIKTKLKMVYMPNESHNSLYMRGITYLKAFNVEKSGKYVSVKNKELLEGERNNDLKLNDRVTFSVEKFAQLRDNNQLAVSSTPTKAPNHTLIMRQFYPRRVIG